MFNLFLYSLLPQILKITRPSLRLGVLTMTVTCLYLTTSSEEL